MTAPFIRVLAIGIFRRGDEILVGEDYDSFKQQTFYRPLGGGVEFGEPSLVALRREMREEIGAECKNERLLGTFENLFICNGQPGHEIVQVYAAEFADPSFYEKREMTVIENNLPANKAVWKTLAFFQQGTAPLYPDGLLEILLEKES